MSLFPTSLDDPIIRRMDRQNEALVELVKVMKEIRDELRETNSRQRTEAERRRSRIGLGK